MKHFDYLIIGSGLVGSTAAIALAQKTQGKIALLDAGKFHAMHSPENPLDTRTLALNATSVDYLSRLGVWLDCQEEACAIQSVDISEKSSFARCRLSAEDLGKQYLGQVIEIALLQKALLDALKDFSSIHLFPESEVKNLHTSGEKAQCEFLFKGELTELTAGTVILAGGTHSPLRAQLGIPTDNYDYEQSAIVAVAAIEGNHEHVAYERFDGAYTLAILPLTHQRVGTVLSLPNAERAAWLELDDASYLQKIESLLGNRFGHLKALGKRQHYPLQRVIAKRFVEERIILLGNIAHTLNPVGAQGLNLGLKGVQDCVETLSQGKPLAEFENRQISRAEEMAKFTHETAQLFGSTALPTRLGRRAALFVIQHSPTLKKRLIRRMMG